MDTDALLDTERRVKAAIVLVVCLVILVGAVVVASLVQRDFGRVEVTNVTYDNFNAILIRAKLLRPVRATQDDPVPGLVYIHGYQNNRSSYSTPAVWRSAA